MAQQIRIILTVKMKRRVRWRLFKLAMYIRWCAFKRQIKRWLP